MTRLPVWSIVVLLRPGGRPPVHTGIYRITGIGGAAFVFRYRVVSLWRLDARAMRAKLGLVAAPFCAAMRGADEVFVRELADEVWSDRTLSSPNRRTTLQLLYVVVATILNEKTARSAIPMMESIMQSPGVQRIIRRWEDKGRDQGRVDEARANVLRVLAARALRVTANVRARINGEGDLVRLESWLEAAVTARTTADVFRDERRPTKRSRRR